MPAVGMKEYTLIEPIVSTHPPPRLRVVCVYVYARDLLCLLCRVCVCHMCHYCPLTARGS